MPANFDRLRGASLNTSLPVDRSRVLDTLVNNLEGMVYRCLNDSHWTMLFVSQGCLALTGYASQDLIQNARVCWEEVTFAEDRSRVRSEIAEAIASGKRFSV